MDELLISEQENQSLSCTAVFVSPLQACSGCFDPSAGPVFGSSIRHKQLFDPFLVESGLASTFCMTQTLIHAQISLNGGHVRKDAMRRTFSLSLQLFNKKPLAKQGV